MSKFGYVMINVKKVIGNRSTFLSGIVTLCTQNVKYFCHLSVHTLWKESLNIDDQEFHQYQHKEQAPLILTELIEHKKRPGHMTL